MASLLKKMFDTMPLKGVLGAVSKLVGGPEPATLGQMARYLKVYRTPPTLTVDPTTVPAAGTAADAAAIWGWQVAGDPSSVTQVVCRVRDMAFAKYLVLQNLDFGYAKTYDAKNFQKAVLVSFNGMSKDLPLTAAYHLVSFKTTGGYISADNNAELWPLESYHDESLLHVFAYDLDRVYGNIVALTSAQHRDKKEVDAMLARCDQLGNAQTSDEQNAYSVLFKDDLWDPTPSNTPPTGAVPEDVDLTHKPIRILVACSLTVCRERDDFQPGKLGGIGRLYPHVMVVADAKLRRIEAGVHFKRPATSTLVPETGSDPGANPHAGHQMDGADEMLPDIKSLLIADSNATSMVVYDSAGIARSAPYWANLFSYYVVDPINDSGVGDKLIPVVRRSQKLVRNEVGWVDRDCSDLKVPDLTFAHDSLQKMNQNRVRKRERQGYFDNLHIAPRMRVKSTIASVWIGNKVLLLAGVNPLVGKTFPTNQANQRSWKMDEVVMAPFCAHDCFHMHWRWSDNHNNEQATFGWGPVKPWSELGRTMVPENQDVSLQLLGDAEFSYLAEAHGPSDEEDDDGKEHIPKNVWQPFCHHGGGYALHVGEMMLEARGTAPLSDQMIFLDSNGDSVATQGWALFYWRLRYRLVPQNNNNQTLEVQERFSFTDEVKALDE